MHEFLTAWNTFSRNADEAPYLLPGDDRLHEEQKLACCFRGWENFIAQPDFGKRSNQLNLGLLPMPFAGNLNTASVFLLMLSPGVGPDDYFGEYRVPEYRSALIKNLHQGDDSSFLFWTPDSHGTAVSATGTRNSAG